MSSVFYLSFFAKVISNTAKYFVIKLNDVKWILKDLNEKDLLITAFNALWVKHYTVLISLWLHIYHPLTVHELKCPNSLCPGEMLLISSVQQDRRAPADRFLRTPIFPPLEGALTPPSSRVSTSSLDNSCWMVKLSSMALSTPWPMRKQQSWDQYISPWTGGSIPSTAYLNVKKDRNVGMSLHLCGHS